MNTIATIVLSVVTELSSPDYVIYPVDDIIGNVPQLTDAPRFGLGGWSREEDTSKGYTESEEDRIDAIRMIIQEDLRLKGIESTVFFFDGNFIVKYQ